MHLITLHFNYYEFHQQPNPNKLRILKDESPALIILTTPFMMFLLAYAVTRETDE